MICGEGLKHLDGRSAESTLMTLRGFRQSGLLDHMHKRSLPMINSLLAMWSLRKDLLFRGLRLSNRLCSSLHLRTQNRRVQYLERQHSTVTSLSVLDRRVLRSGHNEGNEIYLRRN